MLTSAATYNKPIVLGGASLGLVANGKRNVTPIPRALLRLVPLPTDNNLTVKKENASTLRDTIPLMLEKIKRTAWQTKKLAASLKAESLQQTLRNDWNFIFKHIQYKEDERGKEQLRSPRRLIHEGAGDCDCFSCTIGTLLINQKIPAVLRIAKYAHSANPNEFSHVYIVVPKDGNVKNSLTNRSDYYTIDPVVHEFDYEEPYTYKKDFPINKSMELQYLDGLPSGNGMGAVGTCDIGRKNIGDDLVRVSYLNEQGIETTESVLKKIGVPFHVNTLSDGSVQYIVSTPKEQITLPPILGQQDAGALVAKLATSEPDPESPKGGNKVNAWWILGLIAVGSLAILTSDYKKSETNTGTNGLGKVASPKEKKKYIPAVKRKAKPKLRTIKM